jgi:hypothetical protein
MRSMAFTMSTLIHGTAPGAGSVPCWLRHKLAQRTNDTASGV